MSKNAFAPAKDLRALWSTPVARLAADTAERLDAPAVLVVVRDDRPPLLVTLDRDAAAKRLRGSGLTMPPPGGVALLFADEDGVIAVARARSMPMSAGGEA